MSQGPPSRPSLLPTSPERHTKSHCFLLRGCRRPFQPARDHRCLCPLARECLQHADIHVGDTYNDLGAIITAPLADLNLGIKTFLNGTLVSNIIIDTGAAATDIIQYVATDQTGHTATSTRTVIVEAAPSPGPVPATSTPSNPPSDSTATSSPTTTSTPEPGASDATTTDATSPTQ
jgi:hypothetical protein